MDKVPRHIRQHAAAELRRYTATEAIGSLERLFEELHRGGEGPVTRSARLARLMKQTSQSSLVVA